MSVEENSKEELSYRRKNAGGEKCVLLGESADSEIGSLTSPDA